MAGARNDVFARVASRGLEAPGTTATRVRALVLAPLILRVALGAVFFAHGAQKLFGWFGGGGLEGTGQAFGQMGIPYPMLAGLVAGIIEFAGSLLLLAGLWARVAAFVLMVQMLVALVVVHSPNGFFLDKGGIEYPLVLAASLAALVLIGPGRASLSGGRSRARR